MFKLGTPVQDCHETVELVQGDLSRRTDPAYGFDHLTVKNRQRYDAPLGQFDTILDRFVVHDTVSHEPQIVVPLVNGLAVVGDGW